MSTTAAQLMTAEEFHAWVQRPENRDRAFELERGEVIEMPPPGKYHGFVCGNVARILGNFTDRRRKGYVCTNDSGILVEQDPDTVRGPDVSLYEDDETAETMPRGYAEQPPKLTVDVMSPSDRINRMMVRVGELLARGVDLVWVVDPEARDVTVHRSGRAPRLFRCGDALTGEDLLPDLRVRVEDFFAMPGTKNEAGAPSDRH